MRKFSVNFTILDYWSAEHDRDGVIEVEAESREEAIEIVLSEATDPDWVRIDWVVDNGPVDM